MSELMSALIPADTDQCQAVITVILGARNGAFRLGVKRPIPERCPEPTEFIAVEVKPGDNGRRGAMGVCYRCLVKLEEQRTDLEILKLDTWLEVQPILIAHGLYGAAPPDTEAE